MKAIIHMAAECLLFEELGPDEFEAALMKFSKLVRADAIAEERETCANMVDHILKEGGGTWGDAIRARSRNENSN